MEVELRNFQATLFSLCGSGIAPFQSSKCHTLFYMRKRNCGTLSLSIFLVRRRNFKSKNIPCVEAELLNFKSHNSLYVESLWFLMQESEVPGSAEPKAPVAKPSWRCCSQLCHLGGGPCWDYLSLLRSYQS